MTVRSERHLGRIADAASISRAELRDLIETVVEEYLGRAPRRETEPSVRRTGARMVFGESHAAISYVADPEGTDVVPPGWEAPVSIP